MTALLAFFIVLNSLAKEQTGANLHAGTSSFFFCVQKSGNAAGSMSTDRTNQAVEQDYPSPLYAVSSNDPSKGKTAEIGPDEEDDNARIYRP
ncbi:MAG: flagellar motor protein MotB [Pirellulaceae bacterium]